MLIVSINNVEITSGYINSKFENIKRYIFFSFLKEENIKRYFVYVIQGDKRMKLTISKEIIILDY